ncbi:MAG: Acetyl-CoA decarbonylase/synthase complex subunit gamma [Methanocella sp. PtaU1.Bin125]|nr:MAG: Acetyl-CoA decarbonylase/synthase complex subunit gamma [Methanocella sp. PtaU1.Bin125]
MDIMHADSDITFNNRIEHFLIRWGYRRGEHRVAPGLYAIGNPGRDSPVFVTANYRLSFDALRAALKGIDGYVLVLDTFGINVWCAAGKGTFGTEELIRRIEATGLAGVVSHKKLILPQLGAPGVRAPEVTKRTGFRIEYGPVRADDLPAYLKTGKATPGMRRVRFPLWDRIVLIPVELVGFALPAIVLAIVAFLGPGWLAALGLVTAVLGGTVLFPALLPYLPTKDYSTKGLLLGILLSLPYAVYQLATGLPGDWKTYASTLMFLLAMPPVTAYLALNFTGATPFPSRTGVRKEIYTYIPVIAGMAALGALMAVVLTAVKILEMI